MWVFRQVLYRFPKEQEMRIFDGCENGQKIVKNLFKIVHTFFCAAWYYNKCKNPPIHYIVFATPHKKKYLLQKRQS